jgi:hypothetical protein
VRTFEDPIFNEIKTLRDGANQKSPVFLTGFFLFTLSSKKKFLFEENVAILQLKQTIPAQAIIIIIFNKCPFFII